MVLSFRLGSIPVRVHPAFFLVALFLGASGGDLASAIAWVLIVFVSVLLHELGHAAAGRVFGLSPQIDLHGMGGTTSWGQARALTSARRVVVSLAGPLAGLVVGGVVFALARAGLFPATPAWRSAVGSILFVNVGWGVLNLLPMLPLDGGNVLRHGLEALMGERGTRAAVVVSIVVAAVCAPLSFFFYSTWAAMLAAYFLVMNVRTLSAMRASEGVAVAGPSATGPFVSPPSSPPRPPTW